MALFGESKYRPVIVKKKGIPQGVYTKCPIAGSTVFVKERERNQMVVPSSGFHFPISALARHAQSRLPYLSILTNPTMAGVMASYASLGVVILAEPGAVVGFAGPHVIKETTKATLPEGVQTAEFLLKHGLIDQIVGRVDMRDRQRDLLLAFSGKRGAAA